MPFLSTLILLPMALPLLVGWQGAGVGGTAWLFFQEGFVHIIPEGLDHILFVLGLFFICREFSALLTQIALFTVAHSLTFGLGMLGLVALPGRPVEVLIALSIAFVAVENVFFPQAGRRRLLSVFVFGLIHGLGFANAFHEVTISPAHLPAALLSLNLGVGVGHLAVVGSAYVVFSSFWNRTWYRPAVVIPASCLIAAVSLFWAATRLVA